MNEANRPTFPSRFEDAAKEADAFRLFMFEAQEKYIKSLGQLTKSEIKTKDENKIVLTLARLASDVRIAKQCFDDAQHWAKATDDHAKRLLVSAGILYRWYPDAHKHLADSLSFRN